MTYTLTYPTRTEPAMPYELLLGFCLFLCGGLWGGLQLFCKIWSCVESAFCKCAVIVRLKIYLHISKIFQTFVVRDNLINHDATNITTSTETKKKGRLTVASTAVLSGHRFELSRRDLPPLFNNQILNVMRDKKGQSVKSAQEIGTYVPEIKNLHAGSRQSVINGLFNRPINQLVNDFVVEMDAKNMAYYFILENGHFDAFSDYCKNSRKEVCHANS